MIPVQRHELLLRLLRKRGVLSTRALTDELGVSHMTVRRDIAALESDGLVESVVGGVRLTAPAALPPEGRRLRSDLETTAKAAIARAAAEHVEDGATIFLDAGTTCEALVPHLAGRSGVTVVTNDLHSAVALLDHPEVAVVHIGGTVDHDSGSTTGELAHRMLDSIAIDLCLLSTGAWSLARGLTVRRTSQLGLKQAAISASRHRFLLADSSKYGVTATYRVAALPDLDLIVTDDGIDDGVAAQLKAADVALAVAPTR